MRPKRETKTPLKKSALTASRPMSKISKTTVNSVTTKKPTANIKVVVRVRPLNNKETGDNHRLVVKPVNEQILIFDPKEEAEAFFFHGVKQRSRDLLKKAHKHMQFIFDKVFNEETSNQEVYENSTMSLVSTLMDGINCSVFAYGATGAGKTFTMLGKPSNPGITLLTMQYLFETIERLKVERDFELGITYLEVYNELVQDLLNPGAQLMLREDGKFGVVVAGIKYVMIEKADELYHLLEQGNTNRTQHPTDANSESSRSHAVFQVYIKMVIRATNEVRTAKLSMIDLAGSERGSATGFQGARFAEGANINRSLLALGNCINSLADGQRHVPYRDSKLTRLLKDSLGGNCQTVMIANVSPSSLSYEDTYNTLKYATRAKSIKSTIKRNVVSSEISIEHYAKIVEELNKEIARLKAESNCDKCCSRQSKSEIPKMIDELFCEQKDLVKRIFQIELSEQIIQLRSHVKKDANNRLSGLCIENVDKEDRHRRLENTIERFHRQENAIKEELLSLKAKKESLENKIQKLLQDHPEFKDVAEKKENELQNLEHDHKVQLVEKQKKIYEDEFKSRGDLIQKMSTLLKPCIMELKNHGMASNELIKDYESLMDHYHGIRSITWMEDMPSDSGVASTTSIITSTVDDKYPDKLTETTFICQNNNSAKKKQKTTFPVEKLLIKAYKPTPVYSTMSGLCKTPRLKENIPAKKASRLSPRKPLITNEKKTKPLFRR